MLKRTITYTDFNDKEVSETFYFNLTKSELVELSVSTDEGFDETLQRIIEASNNKELIAQFKKIILASYGQKSEDGKRFIKTAQLREEFSQTAAYNALFMELATDAGAAVTFIRGIIPSDMAPGFEKSLKDAASIPPPPAA
jgi:hypothetical protein